MLIIHAETHLVSCFRRNLETRGHSVRVAHTAVAGLQMAWSAIPDLIIHDGTIELSGLPGSSRLLRVVPRGCPVSGAAVALPFRPSELNLHV